MSLKTPDEENGHRSKEPLTKFHKDYLPLKSREFFCLECRSRCTETLDGSEAGHCATCSHRPESFGWTSKRPHERV